MCACNESCANGIGLQKERERSTLVCVCRHDSFTCAGMTSAIIQRWTNRSDGVVLWLWLLVLCLVVFLPRRYPLLRILHSSIASSALTSSLPRLLDSFPCGLPAVPVAVGNELTAGCLFPNPPPTEPGTEMGLLKPDPDVPL